MDIDLLAKMVNDLILDNDIVTLPGVGSFVAELVPSTFSDKGYTVNPPYRRLYFSPRQGADSLLTDLYAESNGLDKETAARILGDFLAEMKEVLKVRKTVAFPGLGRLRATRENHFFFVCPFATSKIIGPLFKFPFKSSSFSPSSNPFPFNI